MIWRIAHTCIDQPNLPCPACAKTEEANKALAELRNTTLVGQVQFTDLDRVAAHGLGIRLEDEPYDEFVRRVRG